VKRALLLLLALGGCQKADDFAFKNTSVTLPDDSVTLPPGRNVELAVNNCLACHSADMITNQPVLTAAQWTANVEKMNTVYKAQIAAADVPAIVDYLVAMQAARAPAKAGAQVTR
jgi:hypothetical protein